MSTENNQVVYKKVGRKYIPIGIDRISGIYQSGLWLFNISDNGSQSITFMGKCTELDRNFGIRASLHNMLDELVRYLMKPDTKPMSVYERAKDIIDFISLKIDVRDHIKGTRMGYLDKKEQIIERVIREIKNFVEDDDSPGDRENEILLVTGYPYENFLSNRVVYDLEMLLKLSSVLKKTFIIDSLD